MIVVDKEFYSAPYYFLLRDKGDKYSLYYSVENSLTEARRKDEVISFDKKKGEKVKKHLSKVAKEKKVKNTKTLKKDLEELVNIDGAMANSKIPIIDPRLHPRKTMDQTVAAASITNDPISRGYRTYYGESIEEMSEEDMSSAFGYAETSGLTGPETYKYYKDELEMEPDEAKERTEQQGKKTNNKMDKKSPFKNDPNFVSRQILPEIQKQKAIKMLEDILMNKKNSSNSDITQKETEKEIPSFLKKNIKSILNQAEKQGISKKDLIKIIQGE